ncbi:MAG: hypothetical protein JEZ08_12140 [Clostridiales bacterium]|nr:hypothetical protein [Clostridiales bacterium]
MTKKSILEKLGLVELVEEKSPEAEIVEAKKVEETVVVPPVKKAQTHSEIEEKLDVLIESYEKNKFLSIEEVYRNKNLDKDVKQSIFIAEVFMKALPENLPMDIKRKSTLNILEASGLKKEDLLNDAYIRIDALNTVLEETVAKTAELKAKNELSVRELEERIEILKRNVEERHEFEEKQTSVIEYEIQRVINIVDGIK